MWPLLPDAQERHSIGRSRVLEQGLAVINPYYDGLLR